MEDKKRIVYDETLLEIIMNIYEASIEVVNAANEFKSAMTVFGYDYDGKASENTMILTGVLVEHMSKLASFYQIASINLTNAYQDMQAQDIAIANGLNMVK